MSACTRPPKGWHCTRGEHADGPCAAVLDCTSYYEQTGRACPGCVVCVPAASSKRENWRCRDCGTLNGWGMNNCGACIAKAMELGRQEALTEVKSLLAQTPENVALIARCLRTDVIERTRYGTWLRGEMARRVLVALRAKVEG